MKVFNADEVAKGTNVKEVSNGFSSKTCEEHFKQLIESKPDDSIRGLHKTTQIIVNINPFSRAGAKMGGWVPMA